MIIGILVLSLSCLTYIDQYKEATAFFLQDSLLKYNWHKDYNNYNYYSLYKNTVTSTNFDSKSLLFQTSINGINFDNVTNLSNNPQDSVYGQVTAASENFCKTLCNHG
jgi:hypothetical protein